MNQLPREWLEFLRQQFPEGSRIKLREMKNDPCPVESGSMGTLQCIDDVGTFHVKWDNGRGLGLVMGQDSFTVLPPETQTLKLYMPMTATYYDVDADDGLETDITMDSREAAEYAPQIIAALQKERTWMEQHAGSPEEAERGLMAYYGEKDGVDQKVQSYHFTAEVRDGRLWGVAECKVQGQLTPLEMENLISGVAKPVTALESLFEQHEIKVGGGLEIYAHLWQDEDWSIMTEQTRFDPHFSERLPDMCWSALPDNGPLIYILRGESGYHVSEDGSKRPGINRHMADYRNRCRGISKAQEQAMWGGCQSGWGAPAADPRTYAPQPVHAEGLPELCFSTLPSTGALICIKRGESGYYPSDWDTGDPDRNKELADYNNERLGVTQAQRLAMEAGSMHDWTCPAADPKTYEQKPMQMGGMS